METIVLGGAAIGSGLLLILRLRARTLFVVFLHLLVTLTVGSLAIRTLSGGGTLLIPFVEGWPASPYMQLDSTRVYLMLAVSVCMLSLVSIVKICTHTVWVSSSTAPVLVTSPYVCLVMFWLHLGAILSFLLLG